ncbi:MAG: apolipoprotein N-acyltransferase [Fuerstiella sp.]|nr:apolipoprotein N-acyltransferase [Fuerstiella sp.]
MAKAIQEHSVASSSPQPALRPEIDRIIESGRDTIGTQSKMSASPVFWLTTFSGVLLWVCFTPVDFAPAAWVALVPMCLLLRLPSLPRLSYRIITVVGFCWAIATLQWMRLGHWTMHGALVALSFYISFYFPAFVWAGRKVIRGGLPLYLAVPIVWTALEYLRAYLMTGFSWYYLGHSQYQWTSLVQICDITGAYGVTFLVALTSGALTECIPPAWLVKAGLAESATTVRTASKQRQSICVSASVGLVLLSCLYGMQQQAIPSSAPPGPIVAVVQGNFTPELKHDPNTWLRMVHEHDLLSRRAAGLRPDLIVWPETMFPVPDQIVSEGVTDDDLISMLPLHGAATNSELAENEIARWHSGRARELLTNRSQESGAAMMVGLLTEVAKKNGRERFNSAAFIRPDFGYAGRYDKMHRVLFGEYIPLRSVLPWLAKLTPFNAGFGIDAGTRPAVFEYAGTRFSPIICFEDTVPHLVRDVVRTRDTAGRTPDVLLNMTNDGWFRGSSELDQHLIAATFRCIETRRPMVRAVNAGISAFIDSAGRIRQPEHFLLMNQESAGLVAEFEKAESMTDPLTGQWYRQRSGVMVGQVPLDGRLSIYVRFGDWFAMLCSVGAAVSMAAGYRKRLPGQGGQFKTGGFDFAADQ